MFIPFPIQLLLVVTGSGVATIDFCALPRNTTCYRTGHPTCCEEEGLDLCPEVPPPCDKIAGEKTMIERNAITLDPNTSTTTATSASNPGGERDDFFRSECDYYIGLTTSCGNAISYDYSDCIDCLVNAVSEVDPFDPGAEACIDDPDYETKQASICDSMRDCEVNRCGDGKCLEPLGGLSFCLSENYRKVCAFCPSLFEKCSLEELTVENCGVQYGDECHRCVTDIFDSVEYSHTLGCEEREAYVCATTTSECTEVCGSCFGEMVAYRDCKDHDSSYDYHRDCPYVSCGATAADVGDSVVTSTSSTSANSNMEATPVGFVTSTSSTSSSTTSEVSISTVNSTSLTSSTTSGSQSVTTLSPTESENVVTEGGTSLSANDPESAAFFACFSNAPELFAIYVSMVLIGVFH